MNDDARRHATWVYLVAAALCVSDAAHALTVRPEFHVTNGYIRAAALAGNTLYIGGLFTEISYATGNAAMLDPTSGAHAPFPKVVGLVFTAIPDGSGGWYIGGSFSAVGGIPRHRLVHILSSGVVDAWNPNPDGSVHALALSGSTLFVGGSFTQIGGQDRRGIAAIDVPTGAVTGWNPDAANSAVMPPNGSVLSIVVAGTTLYAGGYFTDIGGQPRSNIAALSTTLNTASATNWNPGANNFVSTLVQGGTVIYAAGSFTTIGGRTRNRLAALDPALDTLSATPWNPNPNNFVGPIVVAGNTVYVGGLFTSIGGRLRNRIAALDASVDTNNALSWNPDANESVSAMELVGSTLYAGGGFTSIGGEDRNYLAALDVTVDTGNATPWNPRPNDEVSVLKFHNGRILAAGRLFGVNGVVRNNVAAIDVNTGQPTDWNPIANDQVDVLAVSGSTVYAGGTFTHIGGQPRNRIAALDATLGASTAWNPNADGSVRALAIQGNTVYAGGYFNNIGGQPRTRLAALDATVNTNNATAWNANPMNAPNSFPTVNALASSGNRLYVGGTFSRISGALRNNIAALDVTIPTGNAMPWDPNANDQVWSLALDGNRVYAGGDFTAIGGVAPRNHIAALDATVDVDNGTSWNPGANGPIFDLDVAGDTIVAGGFFNAIGGQTRNNLAALDKTIDSNNATSWNPDANGSVWSLAISNGALYVGGSFIDIGDLPQAYIAAVSLDLVVPDPTLPERSRLEPNRPNPFDTGTTIGFTLAKADEVAIDVFDLSGRLIASPLARGLLPAGPHEVAFEGHGLPPGLYLCRLRAGQQVEVSRMVLAR